jgi:hypothetical protein
MTTKAERKRAVTQQVNLDRVLGTYIPALIEVMKQAIGRRCDFTAMNWKDTERLLQTCALAVCDDDFHPAHAKEMVMELGSGYTCWLKWIEKGLGSALVNVPDPDNIRHQLWGAFRMMKPFLYDVDRMTHEIVRGHHSKRQREEDYLEKQFVNS